MQSYLILLCSVAEQHVPANAAVGAVFVQWSEDNCIFAWTI